MRDDTDQKLEGMEAPCWNLWQAFFVLLLYYGIQIPLGWLDMAVEGEMDGVFFAHFFAYCGRFVVGVGLVWGGLALLKGSWAQLGVGRFRLRYLFVGMGAGLGLAFLVSAVMMLVGWIFGQPAPQSIERVLQGAQDPFQIVMIGLCAVVLMPMVEELLFRGMLYPPIRRSCGSLQAVFLGALIFAASHGDVFRFLPLLVAAVGLTWLFEKTRSLWPGIVAHGVWNLVMVVVVVWQGD
ncbi:MAG: CPBP family intramembrane metalloprotease [Peptococcaceae bacterium]|nr:CPBP family intramembrane metalloprotease [Peptococcaceae bacterium]